MAKTLGPNCKFPPKNQQKILNEEFDVHGRPMQKIALLCGPPGLGKTTLAHIVAKHAGYNPVEVNASDDSNPEAFRLQLEAATQMKSVMGNDPRPNCLILDEIDGSLSTAIDLLLQFISDKSVSKGKKQQGGKPKILKRPIICICNDMYAPALRPLRQVALIIHFPPTASGRLAQRLMDIAKLENMKTDFGALLLLCDKTNNDIRSCLSFMHFYKSRGREVRLMDVQLASVGQKDTHKGLFSVWQEIFQIIRHKHIGGSASGKPDGGILSLTSRMGRILRTVQSYGDYDRLSQGVFENYLHMKMRDTRFQSVAVGTEWFCYYDHINTSLKESQSYVLMPYMPYCFAMWHFLYASASYPKLRYPNSGYENEFSSLMVLTFEVLFIILPIMLNFRTSVVPRRNLQCGPRSVFYTTATINVLNIFILLYFNCGCGTTEVRKFIIIGKIKTERVPHCKFRRGTTEVRKFNIIGKIMSLV
ncbi:hypothetical protein B566_EDAN009778 [Ephemera danica]|nr:hypothetical protein B566_EDAN009778 [Ephemera danica]